MNDIRWSDTDTRAMRVALAAAEEAAAAGEVPVGAVVLAGGQQLASGRNSSVESFDPSAHAEIVALRAAAKITGNHRLVGATLYVTLEPCVMCVGAIVQARVARVVFGAYDRKAGALGSIEDLSASKALNHRFEVNGGLLAEASQTLLTEFFRARR